MPCRLDPSKDDKTQSQKLSSSDELYCSGIDPLKEPGDLVAVLVFSPDQHYMRPAQIQTHHRLLGARLLRDNNENRVPSQFPDSHALFALHHRVLKYAGAINRRSVPSFASLITGRRFWTIPGVPQHARDAIATSLDTL
jgi:hypothetical protein